MPAQTPTPGETRTDAVSLLRRYLRRRPVEGGMLTVALYVTRDGRVRRVASRWDDLPQSLNSPFPVWDEIV